MSANTRDPRSSLHGIKVLLVDDEQDARELLTYFLEGLGGEVVAAASASKAFDVLATFEPDVLISDIGMPGEDGYAFMRRLRASDTRNARSLPSLALTAYAGPEHRDRALEAGFTRHLGKPVDLDTLARFIGELAAMNRT